LNKVIRTFFSVNKKVVFLISFLLFILVFPVTAADLDLDQPEYHSFELENGLEFMVFPDHSIPSIKYSTYYNVGSIDEKEGQTGISHFLEHLMFMGTKNLPEGEIDNLITSVGGQLNAATFYDFTFYYHQVPAAALELAAALESDRMRNLTFDQQKVNREREVIKQERRMRVDNNIFSKGFEEIKAYAYPDTYLEHGIIGWMEDISNITTAELKEHYQSYYSPNNALVVVSGDVKVEAVKKMAQKYYADFKPAAIKRKDFKFPKEESEKVYTLNLKTNLPYAFQLYQIPAGDQLELTAVEIFLDILANNQSSRLKEKLQKKEELILASAATINTLRKESFAAIYFIPSNPDLVETAQQAFDRELKLIFEEGITEQEFKIVKKQYQKSLIFSQKNIDSTAETYAINKIRFNKLELLQQKIEYMNNLTKEDVVQIAEKYFKKNQRTRGYILPEAKGGAQQ